MVEIRGPHIPYKQWAAAGTPDPVQDHMNWLEVERWAARLSEQVNAAVSSPTETHWALTIPPIPNLISTSGTWAPLEWRSLQFNNVGLLLGLPGVEIEEYGRYLVSLHLSWFPVPPGPVSAELNGSITVEVDGVGQQSSVSGSGINHASFTTLMDFAPTAQVVPVIDNQIAPIFIHTGMFTGVKVMDLTVDDFPET